MGYDQLQLDIQSASQHLASAATWLQARQDKVRNYICQLAVHQVFCLLAACGASVQPCTA